MRKIVCLGLVVACGMAFGCRADDDVAVTDAHDDGRADDGTGGDADAVIRGSSRD